MIGVEQDIKIKYGNKVGEYVRTRNGISKIKAIIGYFDYNRDCFYEVDKNGTTYTEYDFREIIRKKDIIKHSKNIIDLIEVGDYVNGYKILEKTKIKNNEMQICILKDNNISNWRTINNQTLKSIVTKEQFANMEYRLEENK